MRTRRCQACLPLVVVIAAIASSCAATTTLEFRAPEGSVLELEANLLNRPRKVIFRSAQEFRQVNGAKDPKGTPCSGLIRVDKAILTSSLPADAEKYLIRSAGDPSVVSIKIQGYYWIYRYEKTSLDDLTAQYVDIKPKQISSLLEGKPVVIEGFSVNSDPVFRLELGIVLPENRGA